jgi:hypothetical protein
MTTVSYKAWLEAMPIDDVRRRIERLERKLADMRALERLYAESQPDEEVAPAPADSDSPAAGEPADPPAADEPAVPQTSAEPTDSPSADEPADPPAADEPAEPHSPIGTWTPSAAPATPLEHASQPT